jgi:hypothetical protein
MANREMQFTQKALVPVKVSGISVTLYPLLDASMTAAERAHGFHVCKSNLLASPLPPRGCLGRRVALTVVRAAVAALSSMATFTDAGVSGPSTPDAS